jgi:hypothetical protein
MKIGFQEDSYGRSFMYTPKKLLRATSLPETNRKKRTVSASLERNLINDCSLSYLMKIKGWNIKIQFSIADQICGKETINE